MSTDGERSASPADRRRLTAFGMSITSEVDLLGADGAVSGSLPDVCLRRARDADPRARGDGGETVLERCWDDGSLAMRVRRLPDDAFAVDAPGHGRFHVSPRGDRVLMDDLHGPPERWQRPLFSQVLPLASTLCGHETLHASAVVIDGGAIAITAPSNTGKSSLMINLVDLGAGLLTDDVVALSMSDGRLLAHPGSPLAHLSAEQHAMLSMFTRERLGSPVGDADKRTFAIGALRAGGAPLRALIVVRRDENVPRLRIRRVDAPTPVQVLAMTFMPHVATPARLRLQLDVSATIARSIPVFELDTPASVPARELARVVRRAASTAADDGGPSSAELHA